MEKRTGKFLLAALFCSWQLLFGQSINFEQGTWKEVLDKAAKENKLVFFDAQTSWCGPCKWMAANSFTKPEVADYFNSHFINATFDMEKGEGIDLAKQFAVNAYPTLMFIDGQGTLVHTVVGARDPEALLALGKEVSSPDFMSLEMLQKRFEKGERSPAFLADYILRTQGNGDDRRAAIDAFKPNMDGEGLLDPHSWAVFKAIFFKPDTEHAQYFLNNRKAFEEKFGEEEAQNKARTFYLSRARIATLANDRETYEQTLEEIRASGMPHCETLALSAESTWYHHQKDWAKFAEVNEKIFGLVPWDPAASQNSVAWTLYENTDDKKLLKKGLGYADAAIASDPIWEYLDTKAMLLFKLGKDKEGIEVAERAIATAKASGAVEANYAETQKALDAAKSRLK